MELLAKIRTKNLKKSAVNTKAEFFKFFSFIFWAMRQLHIFILKFIDLYEWTMEEELWSGRPRRSIDKDVIQFFIINNVTI